MPLNTEASCEEEIVPNRDPTGGLPRPCLTHAHPSALPLTVSAVLPLGSAEGIFLLSCWTAQGWALQASEFRKADLCSGQVQKLVFCRSDAPACPEMGVGWSLQCALGKEGAVCTSEARSQGRLGPQMVRNTHSIQYGPFPEVFLSTLLLKGDMSPFMIETVLTHSEYTV